MQLKRLVISWLLKYLKQNKDEEIFNIRTFTIKTERSGLYSQVLVHPKTELKLPINEPDSNSSQIQEINEA